MCFNILSNNSGGQSLHRLTSITATKRPLVSCANMVILSLLSAIISCNACCTFGVIWPPFNTPDNVTVLLLYFIIGRRVAVNVQTYCANNQRNNKRRVYHRAPKANPGNDSKKFFFPIHNCHIYLFVCIYLREECNNGVSIFRHRAFSLLLQRTNHRWNNSQWPCLSCIHRV